MRTSQITRDLLSRDLTKAASLASYAVPLGTDGAAAYSSPGMGLIEGRTDEKEMSAWFKICEGSVDDEGDIVEPRGIVLDRYRKNPLTLYHHDKNSPAIGSSEDKNKVLHVIVSDNDIIAKCIFHGLPFKGENISYEVFCLVAAGALRGASLGFIPLQAFNRGRQEGRRYKSGLMTEWSITPIPANSDTLRMCLGKPNVVKSLTLRTHLEQYINEPIWSNGATLMAHKKLKLASVSFTKDIYKSLDDAIAASRVRGNIDVSSVTDLPTEINFKQSDVPPGAATKTLAPGIIGYYGYVEKAYDEEEDGKKKKKPKDKMDSVEKDKDDPKSKGKKADGDDEDNPGDGSEFEDSGDDSEGDPTEEGDEQSPDEDTEDEPDVPEEEDAEALKVEATDLADLADHCKAGCTHIPSMDFTVPAVKAAADDYCKSCEEHGKKFKQLFAKHYASVAMEAVKSKPMEDDPLDDTPEEEIPTPTEDKMDDKMVKSLKDGAAEMRAMRQKAVA